jgi:hypothetical protein
VTRIEKLQADVVARRMTQNPSAFYDIRNGLMKTVCGDRAEGQLADVCNA